MSWVAQNDRSAQSANRHDFSQTLLLHPDSLLSQGSLVIVYDPSGHGRPPCRLLHYQSSDGWNRCFTVYLNADYSVSVENVQGCARSYVCLSNGQSDSTGQMRLTYSWDAPKRQGLLSLEEIETGSLRQTTYDAPIPLPNGDVHKIAIGNDGCNIDNRVQHIAFSDQVEHVGPAPSIAAGALIETTQGSRPIERLQLGDMVLTQASGAQPVRWIIKRNLPTLGGYAPVLLSAPFFGLVHDIVVRQDQQLVISGTDTQYNFGRDAVFVKARDLIGHPGASHLKSPATVTYFQILLDEHECVQVSGAWAASLFVGRLAESPQTLATTGLADMPKPVLPVHRRRAHPSLKYYETQALLDTMMG